MTRFTRLLALAGILAGTACGSSPPRDHYWSSEHCVVSATAPLPFAPNFCEAYLRRTEGARVLVLHVGAYDSGIADRSPSGALRILLAPNQREDSVVPLALRGSTFPGPSVIEPGQAQLLIKQDVWDEPWFSASGSLGVQSYELRERREGHDELIDLDVELDLSQAVLESTTEQALDLPLAGIIRLRASDRQLAGQAGAGGTGGAGVGGLPSNGGADAGNTSQGGAIVSSAGADDGVGGGDTSLCPVPCGPPGCNALGACNGLRISELDTVALCEDEDSVGLLAGTGTFSRVAPSAAEPIVVFNGPIVDQTSRCVIAGSEAYVATATSILWANTPPATVHGFGSLLGATANDGYFVASGATALEVRRFGKPHAASQVVACAPLSAGVGAVSTTGTVYLALGSNIVGYPAASVTTCASNSPQIPFSQAAGSVRNMVYEAGRLVIGDGPAGGKTFNVVSIDEASAEKTSLGSAYAYNASPLAAHGDATVFVDPTESANGSHLVLEVSKGDTRAIGVITGTVTALAVTSTHVYWSLLQGGVFRAPR
jgi:hypothetical protein